MRSSHFLSTLVVTLTASLVSGVAWSQEEPAAEPAPLAEPAPPPTEEAPPPADPMPMAEPAPEAAPMVELPAPAEEEPAGPSSWFRIDSDGLGLQLWAGTTNDIGGLSIASDIYVGYGAGVSYGEFDIGPTFSAGDLILTPMIGVSFDWGAKELASIVPQFYTIYNGGAVYFESWIQMFVNSVSDYNGGGNTLYTRDFLLFSATDDFKIGPGVELTLGLNDAGKIDDKTLTSLPVGGVVQYNAMGDWQGTISLWLGVETQDTAKVGDNLSGRFTYVHLF